MGKYFVGAEIECPWEELPACKEREILPEMRHMTLNFIGEKQEKPVCLTHPLVIGSAGYFDGVLFLSRAVAYHAVFLSNALRREDFLPHVTIARGDQHKASEWQKWFQPLPFYFKAIHLYKSLGNSIYPNKLKNWEFSKPNSQILSNLKDAREAEPCLKDRADGAGIKSANLGEEKTDSSICLGIYEKVESCSLKAPFEVREHTADLAFVIRGKSLDEMYVHGMIALAFSFPQTVQFFEKKSVRSIEEVVQELNRLITRMDTEIGSPFKAVSYSGNVKQGEWEMIVDV